MTGALQDKDRVRPYLYWLYCGQDPPPDLVVEGCTNHVRFTIVPSEHRIYVTVVDGPLGVICSSPSVWQDLYGDIVLRWWDVDPESPFDIAYSLFGLVDGRRSFVSGKASAAYDEEW